MTTLETTSIGAADIDSRDPFALIERIRFLVRHEHDFSHFENQLRDLAAGRDSGDWYIVKNFLRVLDRYHASLNDAGFDTNYFRRLVADFGLHLHAIQEAA